MKTFKHFLPALLAIAFSCTAYAQTVTDKPSPDVLPGKGVKKYDFFYAGEAKARNMYIVRKGKIVWEYTDTSGRGEISDALLMANANVLFAHQYGVTLINKDKKVLWHYDAPEGYETHTAQMIGADRVVFVQNGNPAKVMVANTKTNTIEKEFTIPFKSGTHGQIRHARLTRAGTLLIAHMDLGKVNEYDADGSILRSIDAPGAWSGVEQNNGNVLIASNARYLREVDKSGVITWEYDLKALAGYSIYPQIAQRLPNGNVLVNSWFNQWDGPKAGDPKLTVQAIEITPEKNVVWALRLWDAPLNLGPATTIQLLNTGQNGVDSTAHFGSFK